MGNSYTILNQKSTYDLSADLGENIVYVVYRLSLKCRHHMPTVVKVSASHADCRNDYRYIKANSRFPEPRPTKNSWVYFTCDQHICWYICLETQGSWIIANFSNGEKKKEIINEMCIFKRWAVCRLWGMQFMGYQSSTWARKQRIEWQFCDLPLIHCTFHSFI